MLFGCSKQETVIEDPAAVPKDTAFSDEMIGLEVHKGDEILFRGGYLDGDSYFYLFNEDGTVDIESFGVSFVTDGIEYDENGNEIDPMEPTALNIIQLINNPKLTRKGNWLIYFFVESYFVY